MISRDIFRLYAITTPIPNLIDAVKDAILGGITLLQIRDKSCAGTAFLKQYAPVVQLCHDYSIPCLINDAIEAAKVLGADGVHLGQGDTSPKIAREILGEKAIIGVSAHNLPEAKKAVADGADYLGCGALFTTQSKGDAIPLAHATVRAICQTVAIPVVGIGGINRENIASLNGLGLHGVAVIGALFHATNIENAARELRESVDKWDN